MKNLFLLSLVLGSASALAEARVVEFHIAPGTGDGAWNTAETAVKINLGDTLRIVNDDDIVHQLHTNGRPCGHGDLILVGGADDCVARYEYDAQIHGGLYDHRVGPEAAFYLEVVKPAADVVDDGA